jgi:hypothetical protein
VSELYKSEEDSCNSEHIILNERPSSSWHRCFRFMRLSCSRTRGVRRARWSGERVG